MQKDDPVCLQPEFCGDVCPQSLHSFSTGDSELHRATGGQRDGQAHGGLASGDLSPAASRPAHAKAAGAPLPPLHSAH